MIMVYQLLIHIDAPQFFAVQVQESKIRFNSKCVCVFSGNK